MNAVLDVAAAIDSTDCGFPGCPYEATGEGMCRDHQGRTPHPAGAVTATHDSQGRLIPGALAHLMHDDEQEASVSDPPIVLCRVDGCTRASVAQTGPWKGWCGEHKHIRGKKAAAPEMPDLADEDPLDPAPPPVAAHAAGSLVQLAQAVEAAGAEVLEARERHAQALANLRAAIEKAA